MTQLRNTDPGRAVVVRTVVLRAESGGDPRRLGVRLDFALDETRAVVAARGRLSFEVWTLGGSGAGMLVNPRCSHPVYVEETRDRLSSDEVGVVAGQDRGAGGDEPTDLLVISVELFVRRFGLDTLKRIVAYDSVVAPSVTVGRQRPRFGRLT